MAVAYSMANASGTAPDGGIASSRPISDDVNRVSASLPISAALPCTDCNVSCNRGRLSARPSVTFNQMFFAAASCSRISRRMGWSLTRSAFSAAAVGMSPARPKPSWTDRTIGVTGALTAT